MATFNLPARWKSNVNKQSSEYKQNYEGMKQVTLELQQRLKESLDQGPSKVIDRHRKAGRLTARERIELLLDEDSPFLELCALAGYGQAKVPVGGNVVGGIGLVCGVECMIVANVYTIKGGSINKTTLLKTQRIGEIAAENKLPFINLTQSGGADLTQQGEVFHLGGGTFRGMAIRSKSGLPTITVVFGSSTAGGAYIPGMSDYTIMVKNQAKVFLGGPPLVRMATGEVVDDETLGGAEMHSKISGVSDFLAQNEHHALLLAREIVSNLNYKKAAVIPPAHIAGQFEEPAYDPEELLGIVGPNIRVPFDIREVIARIVDGSRLSEFKPAYGSTLVTCFARIHGIPVGILGNNGVLFSEAAQKGAQFIHLCNMSNTCLIFLQNITGFMVGKKYEQGGIIKHGAHLINAVSNSQVPAITIIIGASYGAGNYGMCGRAYHPRFLFSWPNSRCSVMGPEQLGGTLDIVFRQSMERQGIKIDEAVEAMANERKQKFVKQIEEESSPYYTTSRMIDDGIIDPRDTRQVLGICLSVVHSAPVRGSEPIGISRY